MHDWNHFSQFAFKSGVEIRAALNRSKAVAVRKLGEDADVTVVFKLDACIYISKYIQKNAVLVIHWTYG